MFPHHDNEMAQSEAYHQCGQWVNYFFHAGHLHIKGLKMSKSLKNFITIRQALQEHSARQLRLMFLMQPWDKPMNYSDQTVDDAKAKEKYFKNFFGSIKSLLRSGQLSKKPVKTTSDKDLVKMLNDVPERVHSSLCNNFRTYEVIGHLVDLVSECNKYLTSEKQPKQLLVKKVATYCTKMFRILGVVQGQDAIGFDDHFSNSGASSSKEEDISPYVDAIVDLRKQIRSAAFKSKHADSGEFLRFCDEVRDGTFANLGIRLKANTSTPTEHSQFENPAVLQRDIEAKRQLQATEEEKLEFPN